MTRWALGEAVPGAGNGAFCRHPAEHPRGLQQGFHGQECAAIPQTGATPGDLGTLPLASLQKLLKKSISELSVVLSHLRWQPGWPIHNVSC